MALRLRPLDCSSPAAPAGLRRPRRTLTPCLCFRPCVCKRSWCGCNNSALFAELVPEEQRSTIFAFDRSFEASVLAAFIRSHTAAVPPALPCDRRLLPFPRPAVIPPSLSRFTRPTGRGGRDGSPAGGADRGASVWLQRRSGRPGRNGCVPRAECQDTAESARQRRRGWARAHRRCLLPCPRRPRRQRVGPQQRAAGLHGGPLGPLPALLHRPALDLPGGSAADAAALERCARPCISCMHYCMHAARRCSHHSPSRLLSPSCCCPLFAAAETLVEARALVETAAVRRPGGGTGGRSDLTIAARQPS